jgi:hypothetical protein
LTSVASRGEAGDADARRGDERAIADRYRLADRALQSFQDRYDFFSSLQSGRTTANSSPPRRAAVSERLTAELRFFRKLLQVDIARIVAIGIIDALEIVEVD